MEDSQEHEQLDSLTLLISSMYVALILMIHHFEKIVQTNNILGQTGWLYSNPFILPILYSYFHL